ncbi:hypothetical protein SALBM311S_09516 [Streptomyces alboniger]
MCPACAAAAVAATGEPAVQRQQLEAMITRGVDVLIVSAVDPEALRSSVESANQAGIPVVAYDRLAQGPISGYVTFDGATVGRLQGEALLKAMGAKASSSQIVMMNGATIDPNAGWFKRGALSVLQGKVKIGKSYDTVGWRPENAYVNMTGAIAALGAGNIDGVLAANDSLAGAVISALNASAVRPLPPVTGQDADLAAVRRIVKGDQYMTVYKPYKPAADAAVEMAVALGRGDSVDSIATGTVDSVTTKDIPAVLLPSISVTAGNIKDTLVKDGMYTIDQICAPAGMPCRSGAWRGCPGQLCLGGGSVPPPGLERWWAAEVRARAPESSSARVVPPTAFCAAALRPSGGPRSWSRRRRQAASAVGGVHVRRACGSGCSWCREPWPRSAACSSRRDSPRRPRCPAPARC